MYTPIFSVEVPVNPLKFDYYLHPYGTSADYCSLNNTHRGYAQGNNDVDKTVTTATAKDCQVKCQQHPACTHWVHSENNLCYLRDGPGILTKWMSMTSGSWRCPKFKIASKGEWNVWGGFKR